MKYNYLVVEGNIGSGKTTLATMLSETYGARLILEKFSDNPFLPQFYKNPDLFAFPLELSFLAERYQQMKNELSNLNLFNAMAVADFYFSKSLIFSQINLKEDEYALYQKLFNIIFQMLPKPDLIIYLNQTNDQLLKNIDRRGRSYESGISSDYLEQVNSGYLEFFKQHRNKHKTLIINMIDIDFAHNPAHYLQVLKVLEKDYPIGITIVELQPI